MYNVETLINVLYLADSPKLVLRKIGLEKHGRYDELRNRDVVAVILTKLLQHTELERSGGFPLLFDHMVHFLEEFDHVVTKADLSGDLSLPTFHVMIADNRYVTWSDRGTWYDTVEEVFVPRLSRPPKTTVCHNLTAHWYELAILDRTFLNAKPDETNRTASAAD